MNIPKDWSNLSDEEAQKYITYLSKHSYKYKITMDQNNVIHIGDIANVAYGIKDKCSAVKINNKYFVLGTSSLYHTASHLYNKMEHKSLPFKTKAKEWWKDEHERVIALTALVTFIGGLVFLGVKADQQDKREKEQFKQEIIKEALEQFKQEQQKMNTTIQYPMQKVK